MTLGDYIDRGPHSRGVMERLAENPFPGDYVALKGNHEALLEAFLADPEFGVQWRTLGGLATLHSFGVRVAPLMVGRNFAEAAEELRAALTPRHSTFLARCGPRSASAAFSLPRRRASGRTAGSQRTEDLLWIRDAFLSSKADFGKVVVHGHTPTEEPEVLPNRINIDTGAFTTGRLTCVVLEGEEHRFITA